MYRLTDNAAQMSLNFEDEPLNKGMLRQAVADLNKKFGYRNKKDGDGAPMPERAEAVLRHSIRGDKSVPGPAKSGGADSKNVSNEMPPELRAKVGKYAAMILPMIKKCQNHLLTYYYSTKTNKAYAASAVVAQYQTITEHWSDLDWMKSLCSCVGVQYKKTLANNPGYILARGLKLTKDDQRLFATAIKYAQTCADGPMTPDALRAAIGEHGLSGFNKLNRPAPKSRKKPAAVDADGTGEADAATVTGPVENAANVIARSDRPLLALVNKPFVARGTGDAAGWLNIVTAVSDTADDRAFDASGPVVIQATTLGTAEFATFVAGLLPVLLEAGEMPTTVETDTKGMTVSVGERKFWIPTSSAVDHADPGVDQAAPTTSEAHTRTATASQDAPGKTASAAGDNHTGSAITSDVVPIATDPGTDAAGQATVRQSTAPPVNAGGHDHRKMEAMSPTAPKCTNTEDRDGYRLIIEPSLGDGKTDYRLEFPRLYIKGHAEPELLETRIARAKNCYDKIDFTRVEQSSMVGTSGTPKECSLNNLVRMAQQYPKTKASSRKNTGKYLRTVGGSTQNASA